MSVGDYLRKLPALADRPRGGWKTEDLEKPDRFETKATRRRLRREHRVDRDKLRARIHRDDRGRCRCCHRKVYLKLKDAKHELEVGHVHEWIPKSLGGDDLEPTNCLLLCAACHPKVQQRYVYIVATDAVQLMRSVVDFLAGPDGRPSKDPWTLTIVVPAAA